MHCCKKLQVDIWQKSVLIERTHDPWSQDNSTERSWWSDPFECMILSRSSRSSSFMYYIVAKPSSRVFAATILAYLSSFEFTMWRSSRIYTWYPPFRPSTVLCMNGHMFICVIFKYCLFIYSINVCEFLAYYLYWLMAKCISMYAKVLGFLPALLRMRFRLFLHIAATACNPWSSWPVCLAAAALMETTLPQVGDPCFRQCKHYPL